MSIKKNHSSDNIPHLRFPEFKEEWEKKKLGEVAEIGRGKSKHRPRDAEFLYGGKYPFIQTGDIRNASLYLDNFTQTYSEAGLKQSKLWNENTLCITIAANIAETTILKIKACFPDSIIGLIPKENETTVLFVKHQFDKFKIDIQKLSQGVAQANLNQERLSNIEFSFPTLPEQKKIASFLSAVDDKIQQLKQKKQLLEQYKKGVMQQLFSQQIRFKDDKGKAFPKWEKKKLGEIAKITTGSTPSTVIKEYYNGSKLFVSPADLQGNRFVNQTKTTLTELGFTKGRLISKGSVLFVCIGSTIGKVAIANDECLTNQQINSLTANENNNNGFLFSLLEYNADEIKLMAGVQAVPQINKTDFSNLSYHFPCKEEQNKIANFLSAIDDKIQGTQQQLQSTEQWKKGLLQKMFV